MSTSSPDSTNLKDPPDATTSTTDDGLPKRPVHFRLTGRNQQGHRKPLYSLAWSTDIHADRRGTQYRNVAVCGHYIVTIYEVELDSPRGVFQVRQTYKDRDRNEQFYACAFAGRSKYLGVAKTEREKGLKRKRSSTLLGSSTETTTGEESSSRVVGEESSSEDSTDSSSTEGGGEHTLLIDRDHCAPINYLNDHDESFSSSRRSFFRGPQLLCVAGSGSIIKVIDTVRREQIALLRGHGNDVFDLQTSPTDDSLLLSASVDESIRLWNLRSFSCVAIFAGQNGHRESVLSLSWHPEGERFASSGRDESVRLWNINDGQVPEALRASNALNPSQRRTSFHAAHQQFPYFATKKAHRNVVDCVKFLGEMILSKSTYNVIVLWAPILPKGSEPSCAVGASAYEPPSNIIALRTFELHRCNLWFVRFATDSIGRLLAVGSITGEVDIWDIDACDEKYSQRLKPVSKSTIRTLAFSPDGKILVTCSDNGQVSKWNEWQSG